MNFYEIIASETTTTTLAAGEGEGYVSDIFSVEIF